MGLSKAPISRSIISVCAQRKRKLPPRTQQHVHRRDLFVFPFVCEIIKALNLKAPAFPPYFSFNSTLVVASEVIVNVVNECKKKAVRIVISLER